MNNLNQYINEKLKIGSNSKVNQKTKPANEEDLKKIILKKIENKETDFNDIDISGIKDLSHLFEGQKTITEIDISEWDVSNVESMRAMFQDCRYLRTTGDLGNWKIDNCKDMSWMFNGCSCLTNIGDLDNWKIDKEVTLKCAFQGCERLKSIGNILHWRPKESNWDIFSRCPVKPVPIKRV